jgi:FkbM family methyltransferase
MGKKARNRFFESTHVNIGDFLLFEPPMSANGVGAVPRRHTQDFDMLFKKREERVQPEILDLKDGESFVDVGANVGYYTLKAASMASTNNSSAKIISIEAHPDNFRALCRNITCNGYTNVLPLNKAIWDSKGTITLCQRVSQGRLLTDDAKVLLDHSTEMDSGLAVQADTLDNIIKEYNVQNIGVIKMDIEGAEVQALKAASETMRRTRKLVVEVHDGNEKQVQSMLQDNGFSTRMLTVVDTYNYQFVIGEKQPKINVMP